MGIVFLLLMLVSLALFIFMIVKTAKSWGGLQVTMLFFIFFSAWVFLFSSAGVARLRIGWVKTHDKYKKVVDTLRSEETKLKYGDLNSTADDDSSLIPLMGKLSALTMDRGRVWRNASVQVQGGEYLVELPAPRPQNQGGAPAPAAPAVAPAEGDEGALPNNLVVYGFFADTTGASKPAAVFLGEFLVVNSAGFKATLRPTGTLTPSATQFLSANGDKPWTIFELMPTDSHEAFVAKGSKPSDDDAFGRKDPAEIAALLDLPVELLDAQFNDAKDPNIAKAELLRSYVRDGQEAPNDINPANDWYLVEFVQPYEVDVDSQEERSSTDGGFFDLSGRTVDARLKRPKDQSKVKYLPGNRTLLSRKSVESQKLVDSNIVKIVKRVYVRSLNSYDFAFRDARKRTLTTIQQMDFIKRENEIVKQANQLGQEQIAARQAERQNLDKDYAEVQKEVAVISDEAARLEAELASIESKIKESYAAMNELHQLVRKKQLGGN